jgi:hypothetical protein
LRAKEKKKLIFFHLINSACCLAQKAADLEVHDIMQHILFSLSHFLLTHTRVMMVMEK